MITLEQEQYIRENYGYLRTSSIARVLNMSKASVQSYGRKFGLVDKKNKYILENNSIKFLCVTTKDEHVYFYIDADDFDKVYNFGKWFVKRNKNKLYIVCNKKIENKRTIVRLHRILINTNKHIDHIDGNGLNNHKSNLRICDSFQNMSNLQGALVSNKSTGFLNITKSKNNKYRAEIIKNKKKVIFKPVLDLEDAKLLVKYVRAKYLPYSQEAFNREDILASTPKYISEYADKKVLEKWGI